MDLKLKRELGLFGATMMGLGSIIGTGIFVSVGISAGIAGPAVLLAIIGGGLIAACNGLSSAQLAANHPVSGGTYEYGYRYLNHRLGFLAGWVFLLAKSASAATAALGFAGYLLSALGRPASGLLVPIALAAILVLTLVVLGGIRRSNTANIIIVALALLALAIFIISGFFALDRANLQPFWPETGHGELAALMQATALMFVAFTGYGRIATLGEEVRQPRQTIPRAIILTLVITVILYLLVTLVGVGTIGSAALAEAADTRAAPLEAAAETFGLPVVPGLVALGAIVAMLGVLLNLILGLSRVVLAMGRRHDLPPAVARLNQAQTTPYLAVIFTGLGIAALALIGSVRLAWSFSAFTVLVYYAITNLAALRLPASERLFPRIIAWAGLAASLFTAFWVEPRVWIAGLILIALGLVWHELSRRLWPLSNTSARAE